MRTWILPSLQAPRQSGFGGAQGDRMRTVRVRRPSARSSRIRRACPDGDGIRRTIEDVAAAPEFSASAAAEWHGSAGACFDGTAFEVSLDNRSTRRRAQLVRCAAVSRDLRVDAPRGAALRRNFPCPVTQDVQACRAQGLRRGRSRRSSRVVRRIPEPAADHATCSVDRKTKHARTSGVRAVFIGIFDPGNT